MLFNWFDNLFIFLEVYIFTVHVKRLAVACNIGRLINLIMYYYYYYYETVCIKITTHNEGRFWTYVARCIHVHKLCGYDVSATYPLEVKRYNCWLLINNYVQLLFVMHLVCYPADTYVKPVVRNTSIVLVSYWSIASKMWRLLVCLCRDIFGIIDLEFSVE